MIKIGRCLFYFLVAVAISCGKHNGQLGMRSREKTALKLTETAKNAAEELPNQPKKKEKRKKRKSQPKDTWWDRWIDFCRFFFPIILLVDSARAQTQCHAISCGLFKGYENEGTFISPFTLRVTDSLNENDVEQLLVNYWNTTYDTVNFWSYPEEIRREACHLFSNRDVDITHTVDTSNGTKEEDATKCFTYSQELKKLFKHTINDILDKGPLWGLHYEKAESNSKRKANKCRLRLSRIGNDGKWLILYPTLVEKKKSDDVSKGYTWDVHTWRENESRGKTDFRSFDLRKKLDDGKIRRQYYSPQTKFRAIIQKHGDNRSRRIKKLRELGVASLNHKNIGDEWTIGSYCDDDIKLGMHLISVGGEFLHVANYEEAMQIFNNYLKTLLVKK